MVGSALFMVGSFGPVAEAIGAEMANVAFFAGSWGFTGAALVQLVLSGPVREMGGRVSAEWSAAATQFAGTLLFNLSTGMAIFAHTVAVERQLVWAPDARGSVLFLISGVLALVALARKGRLWRPWDREWFSNRINMAGCVAFGVSAVAAFVTATGGVENASLAAWATFVGAVCFFLASAAVLPGKDGGAGAVEYVRRDGR